MKKINEFMKRLRKMPDFNRVKFVILFGSYISGKQNKFSDIDLAIYYNGNSKERFRFRIKLGSKFSDKLDIQIFQDLPIYIRKEVLKGKIIYAEDISFVYDKVYETIRDFDDFREAYYDYINTRRTKVCSEREN